MNRAYEKHRRKRGERWPKRVGAECPTTKVCYPTEAAASRQQDRVSKFDSNSSSLRVNRYKCQQCGYWHIGRFICK